MGDGDAQDEEVYDAHEASKVSTSSLLKKYFESEIGIRAYWLFVEYKMS